MIPAATGKGVSRPLNRGPSECATAVSVTTTAAAESMRIGISHAGDFDGSVRGTSSGSRYSAKARATAATINEDGSEMVNRSRMSVKTKKTALAAIRQRNHDACRASRAYTTQYAASEMSASIVACAARAANAGPCSSARNKITGPEV